MCTSDYGQLTFRNVRRPTYPLDLVNGRSYSRKWHRLRECHAASVTRYRQCSECIVRVYAIFTTRSRLVPLHGIDQRRLSVWADGSCTRLDLKLLAAVTEPANALVVNRQIGERTAMRATTDDFRLGWTMASSEAAVLAPHPPPCLQ